MDAINKEISLNKEDRGQSLRTLQQNMVEDEEPAKVTERQWPMKQKGNQMSQGAVKEKRETSSAQS